MFLNQLSDDEKVSFLKLAHHIANSDNDYSDVQKEIIVQYCSEMQVSDITEDEKEEDYSSVIDSVKNPRVQKIIILEIMALVYSDNYLHVEEEKILKHMSEAFNVSESLSEVYTCWSKSILALYGQANALISI